MLLKLLWLHQGNFLLAWAWRPTPPLCRSGSCRDGSNQRSLCRTFCPCLLIGCCRFGFPLLRGQMSKEAANVGLALERHFVGLPGLADQYTVDPPPPPWNEAKKVCYTCDSAKLFLAPKGLVLGENVRYRSPKVIYLPNKGSFRPPARIH
jgi:hypothetical protein